MWSRACHAGRAQCLREDRRPEPVNGGERSPAPSSSPGLSPGSATSSQVRAADRSAPPPRTWGCAGGQGPPSDPGGFGRSQVGDKAGPPSLVATGKFIVPLRAGSLWSRWADVRCGRVRLVWGAGQSRSPPPL